MSSIRGEPMKLGTAHIDYSASPYLTWVTICEFGRAEGCDLLVRDC